MIKWRYNIIGIFFFQKKKMKQTIRKENFENNGYEYLTWRFPLLIGGHPPIKWLGKTTLYGTME